MLSVCSWMKSGAKQYFLKNNFPERVFYFWVEKPAHEHKMKPIVESENL